MKKALVGCLMVFVLLIVVGGAGVYFGMVRPGMALIERGKIIADYESELVNQRGFEPPADGRLNEDLVTRYVEVRRAISAAADGPVQDIAPALQNRQDIQSFGEFVELLGDAKDAVDAAYALRSAQIAAMNEREMSRSEFEWVGARFFTVVAPGIDPQRLREMLSQGTAVDWDAVGAAPSEAPDAPAAGDGKPDEAPAAPSASDAALVHNAELVEPYREEAQAWVQLFAMGF